jgi:hypothetical protein
MRRLACVARCAAGLGGSWALALLVAAGCTPLQEVKTGECGNGFVEPSAGEECDDPARDDCGAPGTSFECRLICVEDACQEGYICGGDGRCRKPSGRLELQGSSSQGYDVLRFADFDGDGRDDLMGTSSDAGLLDVHYLSFEGSFAQTASLPWSTTSPFAPVGDFTGDGYADLVAPTNAGFGLVLGWFDRSFQPLIATLPAGGAEGTSVVDAIVQRPPPSYYDTNAGGPSVSSSSDGADVVVLLQQGSNGASLVLRSPMGLFSPEAAQLEEPFLFEVPPATSLEGVVVADFSTYFQTAGACPEVARVQAGATKIELHYLCTADGQPNKPGVAGFVPPGSIDFGGGVQPSGKAFYVELHNIFVPGTQLFLDKAPGLAMPGAEGGLVFVPILKDAFYPEPLPLPYPSVAYAAQGLSGEVLHVSNNGSALRVVTSAGLFECVGDDGGPPTSCSQLQVFPFSLRSVTLADVDGDEKGDVVAMVDGDSAGGGSFIAVGLTAGDGLDLFELPSPGPIDQVGVGDIDGDFVPDVVTTTDVGTDPAGQTVRALTVYYGTGSGGFEDPVFPSFFPTSGSRILVSDFFPYAGDGLVDPVVLSRPLDGGNVSFSPAAGDPSRLLLTPFVSLEGDPLYGVAANLYDGDDAAPDALDLLALTRGQSTFLRMMVKPTVQQGDQVYPDYLAEHQVDLVAPVEFQIYFDFASFLRPLGFLPKGAVVARDDGTDGLLLFVPAPCVTSATECYLDSSESGTVAYWITSGSVGTAGGAKPAVKPLVGADAPEGYTFSGLVRDVVTHDVDGDGSADVVFLLESAKDGAPSYTVHVLYGVDEVEGVSSLASTEKHLLPPDLLGAGTPTSLGVLDIDGDGVAEVLVNGAPAPGVFDSVRVYTGPNAPPPDAYEWVRWGASAMVTGDVNDDEVADLVVTYVGSGGLTQNGFTQIYVAKAEQPGGQ